MHTHMNGGRRLSDGRPAVACISIFLATLSLSDLPSMQEKRSPKPRTSAQIAEARRNEAASANERAAARMAELEVQHEQVQANIRDDEKVVARERVVEEQGTAKRAAAETKKVEEWEYSLNYLISVANTPPSASIVEFRR